MPYYSFRYGWVYGIVLAVGGQVDVSPLLSFGGSPPPQVPFDADSAQLAWIRSELIRASTLKRMGAISWIVVWPHTPIYSSSDGHKGGNADMRPILEPLFVKHKVTLIIAGDDHVYERAFPRFAEHVDGTRASVRFCSPPLSQRSRLQCRPWTTSLVPIR